MKKASIYIGFSRNIFVLLKRKWFLLLTCVICAYLLVLMFKWGLLCTSLQIQLHIQNVCNDFASGQYVGKLCPALCQQESISSVSCHQFHLGKETVFSGIWDNKQIVFKSPRTTYIDTAEIKQWSHHNKLLTTEDEFVDMIKRNIKLKFNISINDAYAKRLSHFQLEHSNIGRNTEMGNAWSLLQDNEYLALTLYEKYDVFPKLLGSCGSLFAVQKLKIIPGFRHLISLYDSKEEWKNRIKIAIKIIEFLNVLEQGPSDPLHICDVKMSHFGVTDNLKKVKFVDLDSVHPFSIVNRITANGSPCKEHSDCDFLDCRSFCNFVTKKCQFGVVNNNMQIVCEKIFLGWVVPDRVIVPGLILGPHTPLGLIKLLESCANPLSEPGKPRASTKSEVSKSLYNVLVQLSLP